MNLRKRTLYVAVMISFMLAASIIPVQGQLLSSSPAQTTSPSVTTNMNSVFQSAINQSYYGSVKSSTSLFSPFVVNNSFVYGKYVNFVLASYSESLLNGVSVYGPEIVNFELNQTSISAFPAPLFSYMSFLSPTGGTQIFTSGVRGSIFYIYSPSLLLIIHDDPQGIIQLYSNNVNVYVSITLSTSLTLSGKQFPVVSAAQKGFNAISYSNANMTGYIMSGGSQLNLSNTSTGQISVSNQVQTTVHAHSFLSAVQVPNSVSAFNSALSYLAQGMSKGVVSYFGSATLSGGKFSYESSYATPSVSVTSVSIAKNNIYLSVGNNGAAGPATMVFLFGGGLYNLTGNEASVYVNGQLSAHQAELTSLLLDNPGNSTSYNITHVGGYTLVAVSSPNPVSSVRLASGSPSGGIFSPVSAAATAILPLAAALVVMSIASVALYRRKSKGNS